MKWRKIKVKVLLGEGLLYRFFIICCNALFFWLGVRPALEHFGPLGASLIWNTINAGLYFLYHYPMARMFKIGKD